MFASARQSIMGSDFNINFSAKEFLLYVHDINLNSKLARREGKKKKKKKKGKENPHRRMCFTMPEFFSSPEPRPG